jgi:hypothetical protein
MAGSEPWSLVMAFEKGQSGNPAGRPKGARNRTTLAMQTLLQGEAEALTRKVIRLAKKGDLTALRFCLDRLFPPAREHVVTFALPKLETAADSVAAAAALAAGVADGELTPGEADRLARLVQAYTKAIEIADLAPRIEKLEEERREELERYRQRWP